MRILIGKVLYKTGLLNAVVRRIYRKGIWLDSLEKDTQFALLEDETPPDSQKTNAELFPAAFPFEHFKNIIAPNYKYGVQYGYILSSVSFFSSSGFCFYRNKLILDSVHYSPGGIIKLLKSVILKDPFLIFPFLFPSIFRLRKVNIACSLISGWSNYYHWITEQLPKLRAVDVHAQKHQTLPHIIIPNNPPHFMLETLDLLGYKDQILTIPSNKFRIGQFIIPTFPELTRSTAFWLKSQMLQSVGVTDLQNKQKIRIFVSRADAKQRRISNEDELFDLLKLYGFQRYQLSGMSVKDQVQLFSQASSVFSIHGAGLTNILWASACIVFEVLPPNERMGFHYARMSEVCNHKYIPLLGEVTDEKSNNLKIETSEVRKLMDEFFPLDHK